MKRFYCTICKKVKRVRVLPDNIQDPTNEGPEYRIGTCRRHYAVKTQPKVSFQKFVEKWTEQAEGRFNRTNSKVRKVR